MSNRITGTVKWFSNKKGYGFITLEDDEDIFVHQTEVDCGDAYRSLNQGWVVEFDIAVDEDGKKKAVHVTSVGGGPCTGPRTRRHKSSTTSPWHSVLSQQVKNTLRTKSIRTRTGTVDVTLDSNQKIKLGTGGYASMAHADGILAEGSFVVSEDGSITLDWERAIQFDGDEWTSRETDNLVTSLSLMDDSVGQVSLEETPESLWGDDKTDPREALQANGFRMRQVILAVKAREEEEEEE